MLTLISQQTVKYQANQTNYMVKIVEMDEHVKLEEQVDEDVGSVILLNKFNVNPEDVDEFMKRWAADAAAFKKQPGFISAQLHRGIAGSSTFINYAVWESAAHFKRAVNNVDVQARVSEYPASIVISPHLFKKVAVPGICVD
jgi:heme-degrading monooxygenase HmoA